MQKKVILIFGAESTGVSKLLIRLSDFMISVEGTKKEFPYTLVDSLNVGVSAGIIINSLKQGL